ncbi:hypothetical protein HNP84_005367 [Thermocatellispora tengchongensis]|uniref:Uncharacterized protein n=1 Tax=Thermocatellispora tengchongensis TaxID=1073253 RepID=A0A840PCH0_9ACTN|nr:hypothetical protein [Thermocatellispora tengchongensis]MBB5135623.1 hypothetical protein [Thermocatellispora tengchongensis]
MERHPPAATGGFQAAFWACLVVAAVGALIALALPAVAGGTEQAPQWWRRRGRASARARTVFPEGQVMRLTSGR